MKIIKEAFDGQHVFGSSTPMRYLGHTILTMGRKASTFSSPAKKQKTMQDITIVRVKDRLSAGTRDVLVNLRIG